LFKGRREGGKKNKSGNVSRPEMAPPVKVAVASLNGIVYLPQNVTDPPAGPEAPATHLLGGSNGDGGVVCGGQILHQAISILRGRARKEAVRGGKKETKEGNHLTKRDLLDHDTR